LTLKVGIINVEGWYFPQTFARILKDLPEVELVSVAHMDARDEDMKIYNAGYTKDRFAREFGVKLYREEELEAVCVCGQYVRHADYVEMAAKNGVHVFIEKPMAVTMEDAGRIVEAGKKYGVIMATGEMFRFSEALREARERIEKGEIGRPISARVMHQHGNMFHLDPRHWYLNVANGGPELSLGWYTADLIGWFMGFDVTRVFAEYGNFRTKGSPYMDNGKALVRFKNGCIGSMDIYFSVEWPLPSAEVEVIGTEGSLVATESAFGNHYTLYKKEGPITVQKAQRDREMEELRHWVNACINKTRPEIPAEDGRRITEIALAWREAVKTKQPVNLPLKM